MPRPPSPSPARAQPDAAPGPTPDPSAPHPDEAPPPLGSWAALYALVLAALAVQVAAYLLLTRWAA